MEDKTLVAELLDVPESVLNEFVEEDAFNDKSPGNGNRIYGFISHQNDHRYGAMVVLAINSVRTEPQIIYATPKLKYPFSRTGEGEDRAYKFPAFVKVNVYEKLDGTNVCAYSYADAEGKRYVTFKTRLKPVLGNSKFGPFRELWNEMLVKYPELREPPKVLSGEQTLSFELFGYRNPHLIAYTVDLDTRLLFGVKQDDHSVLLPEHIDLPDAVKLKAEATCTSKENLVSFYEKLREDVDRHNKALDDETIEGSEGYIFYVLRADNGLWDQFKCKGETVETIHWASDFLPMSVIMPTTWNALESCEGVDEVPYLVEYVRKLLAEEFTPQQITKSSERIHKAVNMVIKRAAWRDEVATAYKAAGLTFDKDGKGAVMRAISKHFDKKQMKDVFNALKELGYAPLA
jgi:hypothetical protein